MRTLKGTLGSSFLFLLLISPHLSFGQLEVGGGSLGDVANVMKAQGQLLVDMAQARMLDAQAAFVDAQTRKVDVEVEFLRTALKQYQLELRKANMARHALESQASDLEGNIRTFNVLMAGMNTALIWQAYHFIYLRAIPIEARLAGEALVVPAEAKDRDNLINAPFDFPGNTVGDLFDWLGRMVQFQIGVRPSSSLMTIILQAMSIMTKPATDKLARLQSMAANFKAEDSTLWKPDDIINLVNGDKILGSTSDGKPPNSRNTNIVVGVGGGGAGVQ